MRLEDLSPADQKLVNTNFGELEKEAEARVQLAQEMYETGFNKLATETADSFDKIAEEEEDHEKEETEKEEKLEEGHKKASADLGSFIERGFFDGLRKLGAERHDNEMHYIIPFIEEKVAAAGARAALTKFWKHTSKAVKGHANAAGKSVSDAAGKGKKAITDYGKKTVSEGRTALTGFAKSKHPKGAKPASIGQRAIAGAKAVGRVGVPTGALGGSAYLALRGKKSED